MFDLSLFRLPTFTGGSVAAFGLSASIFAMLLYIVLYLQDILGYSPLGTGVRVMFLSGAILVSATVAGRLTSTGAGPAGSSDLGCFCLGQGCCSCAGSMRAWAGRS